MKIYLVNSRNTNASSHNLQESIRENTNENNGNLQTSELISVIQTKERKNLTIEFFLDNERLLIKIGEINNNITFL